MNAMADFLMWGGVFLLFLAIVFWIEDKCGFGPMDEQPHVKFDEPDNLHGAGAVGRVVSNTPREQRHATANGGPGADSRAGDSGSEG